jgi:hypothetical protein
MVFLKFDLGIENLLFIFLKFFLLLNRWMLEGMKLGLEYLKTDTVVNSFFLSKF